MEIRTGRISSINYASGKAEVVYPDKDNMVTQELPLLSFEYDMPEVDDVVLVVHLSSDIQNGVIIGKYFDDENAPKKSGANIYRKDFGVSGECYIECFKTKKEISLHAKSVTIEVDEINFKCSDGTISAKDLLDIQEKVKQLQEDVEKLKSYH